jgi:hypothetical protein
LGEAEEPWWKKAAQGVMETMKDKLVKKEPAVEPNFGRTHPQILAEIKEKFRGNVIHIWELGKFKSENQELACYGVMFKDECEFDGMDSFTSTFVVYSGGKAQFAIPSERKFARSDMLPSIIASELNWFSSLYLLYKEFASTKLWVKYNRQSFEEFKIFKLTTVKKK